MRAQESIVLIVKIAVKTQVVSINFRSLKVVDESVLGFEKFDLGNVVSRIKPDVIALGYDQTDLEEATKKYVTDHKLDIRVTRIGKFEEDELDSSSKIRRKITKNFIR